MTYKGNVLLCGCGWLGNQLVAPLQHQNHIISATSRDRDKIDTLIAKGVVAAPFSLGEVFPDYLLIKHLTTTAILMLPPGRRSVNTDDWEANVIKLIDELLNHQVAHIIFISSTSVYGDSDSRLITEKSSTSPETSSAQAHVHIENYLQQHANNQSTVLRLAGLTGFDRHPAKSLAGRQLTAPNKRVNLIHGEDVVRALQRLIEMGPQTSVLHLCSHEHPQRRTYYDWSARKLRIPPAEFQPTTAELPDIGKIINSTATWSLLGLEPVYPSPFDMLS